MQTVLGVGGKAVELEVKLGKERSLGTVALPDNHCPIITPIIITEKLKPGWGWGSGPEEMAQ